MCSEANQENDKGNKLTVKTGIHLTLKTRFGGLEVVKASYGEIAAHASVRVSANIDDALQKTPVVVALRGEGMIKSEMDCHIHFKHSAEEVAALKKAIIPMQEYIRSVGSQSDRAKMRAILGCEYFRARSATDMVAMLIKAAKYAKAHLSDYFPLMRAQILDDALALEEAALDYKATFAELKNETIPTH